MTDIRTAKQKARQERDERICKKFRELSEEHPEAAPSRLFSVIAEMENFTREGIRQVLVRNGLYASRKTV